mgnify:CR=1 FL=1
MSNLTRGQKILAHIKVLQKFIQEPEVIELCNSDNEKYNELLIEKFSQLKNNNEQLFKIASSHVLNEEEYNILHMMLSKVDKIDNNEITEKEASVDIGQNLYNKYVKHHIDEEKEKEALDANNS